MPVIVNSNSILGSGVQSLNVMKGTAAPTANVTGLGVLAVGDLYIDTTTGIVYSVTATNGTSTITFTVVGAQT